MSVFLNRVVPDGTNSVPLLTSGTRSENNAAPGFWESATLLPMHPSLKQALLEWRSQSLYNQPGDFVSLRRD